MGSDLERLASLLARSNAIEAEISAILGRPSHAGHIGEYVAACVFGIALEASAVNKAHDGRFVDGPLRGRTVNVKYKGGHDGLLDLNPNWLPDDYLVLTGPRTGPVSSRGLVRAFRISSVFLFDAAQLVERLHQRGVKIGPATSLHRQLWDEAELFPTQLNASLTLSDEQRCRLALFE
ncbi:MAG: hypothetical protein IT340_22715 [Chloroflexi bacterium]|nr:hypothetical protein [Chloroflexota bacterium]